jgi:hypothetical protein
MQKTPYHAEKKKCYGNVALTYANMSLNSYFSSFGKQVIPDQQHASSTNC